MSQVIIANISIFFMFFYSANLSIVSFFVNFTLNEIFNIFSTVGEKLFALTSKDKLDLYVAFVSAMGYVYCVPMGMQIFCKTKLHLSNICSAENSKRKMFD